MPVLLLATTVMDVDGAGAGADDDGDGDGDGGVVAGADASKW